MRILFFTTFAPFDVRYESIGAMGVAFEGGEKKEGFTIGHEVAFDRPCLAIHC